jgi:uncharacterized membrane protein HdeD (DUF308 family)
MSSDPSQALKRTLHAHSGLFIAEGIVLGILGIAAIVLPFMAGLATTIVLGWLFLIAGIVGLLATFGTRSAPGFGWSLISAVLALLVGIILLWNPLQGLVTLTAIMTAYFIVDGISMISLAIAHRRELSGRWEILLANGVFDLILAAVVILGLPGTLAWALGVLVGIDLIFGAAALIAIALAARNAA